MSRLVKQPHPTRLFPGLALTKVTCHACDPVGIDARTGSRCTQGGRAKRGFKHLILLNEELYQSRLFDDVPGVDR
jgi:hypothetical protein